MTVIFELDVDSDGVKTFFSETGTFAKTQVSRHETSQDISD